MHSSKHKHSTVQPIGKSTNLVGVLYKKHFALISDQFTSNKYENCCDIITKD
jgi:hypothetical protein